ncbi:MAG: hypothetical protein E7370_05445 [Clostridiales bacterium]|nr:hypothetical protein [Clostridiales bacterium]
MYFFIFLICLSLGIVSGVFYDFLYVIRAIVCGVNKNSYTLKDKIFIAFCDVLYFVALAISFIFLSLVFNFYTLRFYMILGCAIGALLYFKSFHLCIAFFIKMVYNKINKVKLKQK